MYLGYTQLKNMKELIILLIISIIITILSRNILIVLPLIFFAIFSQKERIFRLIQKRPSNVTEVDFIENGILKLHNFYLGILIVDDIKHDFNDLTEDSLRTKIESFHRLISIDNNIKIIMGKQKIDKQEYLSSLFRRAQNLRISVEADPSNEKNKAELSQIEKFIEKINNGREIMKYYMVFMTSGNSPEEVRTKLDLIINNLLALDIKARRANRQEITNASPLLFSESFKNIVTFSLDVPWFSPYTLPKAPSMDLIGSGIYLGVSKRDGNPVFWSVNTGQNGHVLVIGPTGSGKTEFLLSLGVKSNLIEQTPVVIFDIKGDFKQRLKKNGIPFRTFYIPIFSPSLLKPVYCSLYERFSQIVDIIGIGYNLDFKTRASLYEALRQISELKLRGTKEELNISWDDVMISVDNLDIDYPTKYMLKRILSELRTIDENGIGFPLDYEGLNVVDLTTIKSDEVKTVVILGLLRNILNKYSSYLHDRVKLIIIIDEAWLILKDQNSGRSLIGVGEIIKKGRGHGLALFMATQNIQDLGNNPEIVLNNVGLLAFMNNGDKKMWGEVDRFSDISKKELMNTLLYMKRGESYIRFLGDNRGIPIEIDVLL